MTESHKTTLQFICLNVPYDNVKTVKFIDGVSKEARKAFTSRAF